MQSTQKRRGYCQFPLTEIEKARQAAELRRKRTKAHCCVCIIRNRSRNEAYLGLKNTTEAKQYEVVYHTNPAWQETGRLVTYPDRELRGKVIDLLSEGLKPRRVAEQTGVSASYVYHLQRILKDSTNV